MLVKLWTADEKHSLRNGENFPLPIQMQLSKKGKTFSGLFSVFLKFILNFQYFQNKDDFHGLCISEVTDCERCG